MHISKLLILVSSFATFPILNKSEYDEEFKKKKELLVKKHLKRLKKVDGGIKLVGGRDEFEGNVEILYNGTWGAICDDEWDIAEASVVCKQLGYPQGHAQATANGYFGIAKRKYWMDNVFCDGSEKEISLCRFDGWGNNDCTSSEAAGVICIKSIENDNSTSIQPKNLIKMVPISSKRTIRLRGGRISAEGRIEVKTRQGRWDVVCADGWSLKEALIVCKTLGLGFANAAIQTTYFGGNLTASSLADVRCMGNETSFSDCQFNEALTGICRSRDVAAVSCTKTMADLVIDHVELMRTAYLEDKQMFFLQCAMEENCVASTAYEIQKENDAWHLETRRLLRFTARILNAGTAEFRPSIPKHLWEWHMCHMHYHSMEVFATFDIFDDTGKRVAEGHKASFCLEDNQCLPGVKPKYACANYGDQGISVNCSDIYKHTVDCQWVDITDLNPGTYKFKVAINPEFKVPEMGFQNNAALCDFLYSGITGTVTNCVVQSP